MIYTLSGPINLCLGITKQCNLACQHCFKGTDKIYDDDLTFTQILGIIRQIKELNIFNVSIFGGEPLCRSDFFLIVEKLSKLPIRLSLNTNGTLIARDVAKRLAKFLIRSCIVSLDGSCAKVHDLLRGEGAFDKTLYGIENLLRENMPVFINTVVTKYNFRDLENIAKLVKKLKVKARFNNVVFVGNAACYHQSLLIGLEEKRELFDSIRRIKKRYRDYIEGSALQEAEIVNKIEQGACQEVFPLKVGSCGAGTVNCFIRPDGRVTPCLALWEVIAGNVKEESLYDIWHYSPVMREFREDIEISKNEISDCVACEYLELCYKGHRCSPYYYPDKFKQKELYCLKNC